MTNNSCKNNKDKSNNSNNSNNDNDKTLILIVMLFLLVILKKFGNIISNDIINNYAMANDTNTINFKQI